MMNRCHVCHGKGIKIDDNLKKTTCAVCKGTGAPQPLIKPKRVRVKAQRKYIHKNSGMDKLDDIEGI